jgi:hypothetical protein
MGVFFCAHQKFSCDNYLKKLFLLLKNIVIYESQFFTRIQIYTNYETTENMKDSCIKAQPRDS